MKKKLSLIGLLLGLDQISKFWAHEILSKKAPITFIPKILELHYSENTGMAFSLFEDHYLVLTIFVSIVVLGMILYIVKTKKLNWTLVFMLSGGLGNLLDRLIYGHVVDFINFLFVDFAIFNIADIYLNIAAALMLLTILKPNK